MQPLDDYPIGTGAGTPPPPQRRDEQWRVWTLAALALVIVAGLAAFVFLRRANDLGAPERSAAAPAVQQPQSPGARGPLGPAVEPRELPPIDLADPLVRELLSGLSSRPELAAWLATDGLIRNIVATVDSVANGIAPSAQLRPLAPARPFVAEPRGEEFVIDARSYRRYDGIGDTADGIDAEGLARAYAILRPRLQEAYREMGYPDGNFDDAVERAIVRLLNTPVLERDVDVRPAPVLYQFTDQRLERLTAAQKQLLRMGPRNVRLVQNKLREVAGALGIPPERLP